METETIAVTDWTARWTTLDSPSPCPLYVVGTSRCDVRAACSGATPSTSIAIVARTVVPPATTRSGTARRAIPTIALNTRPMEEREFRCFRLRLAALMSRCHLLSLPICFLLLVAPVLRAQSDSDADPLPMLVDVLRGTAEP